MSNEAFVPVFDRAVALLQDFEGDDLLWMFRDTRLDDEAEATPQLELLWADRLEKESYREALSRELDWQFELNRRKDYIVCSTPRISLIVHPGRMEVISREDAVEQGFGVLEVYPVQLFGRHSRPYLRQRDDVCFQTLMGMRSEVSFTRQTNLLLDWLDVAGAD